MPHDEPDDPPRRRANKVRGHGTWENDRPPVCGVIGRQSKQMRLDVTHDSKRETLEPLVVNQMQPGTTVNTDDWGAYGQLDRKQRSHAAVNHSLHEWARDDDGDGVREVHVNTSEGSWTGLRNFLRIFRGVNKVYLQQYAAIYAWGYCLKAATDDFWCALLGVFTLDTS